MRKTAFTLSELMIALTVLGLLCAALLPAIVRTMPNQNKVMIKRAYYTTANIVSDMINDPNLYPPIDSNGFSKVGFDNMEEVTYAGQNYGGTTIQDKAAKFIGLFAAHLNVDGEIEDECPAETVTTDPDAPPIASPGGQSYKDVCRLFTTPDGINWDLRTKYHPEGFGSDTHVITVDVNGDKKPNCLQGDSDADNACKSRTKNFDRFSMEISNDGTIEIPEAQTWAREALQVSSSLTD